MRSIALQTMVGLLIAILIGVVIIVVMYSSGVVENFEESTILMLTTVSSYFRIIILKFLDTFISAMSMILLVIFLFKLATGSLNLIKGIKSLSNLRNLKLMSGLVKAASGSSPSYLAALGPGLSKLIVGFATLTVYVIISTQVLPLIPLYAPHININIGTSSHPATNTTLVAAEIAEKISNTWNAFGAGSGNPLEGLRNPWLFYTIFVHMNTNDKIYMYNIYTNLTKRYGNIPVYVYCNGKSNQLGDPAVFGISSGEPNTIQNVGSDCYVDNNTELKIYYLDSIDNYNILIRLTAVQVPDSCPYITGVGNVKDSVVVCVINNE